MEHVTVTFHRPRARRPATLSCGPSQSFAWCRLREPKLGKAAHGFDHDFYRERAQHFYHGIESRAHFPSKGSVETFTTQPGLLRKSCHTLSAHHIANRFRGESRISRRERVVQGPGNHLRGVPIFSSFESAALRHCSTPFVSYFAFAFTYTIARALIGQVAVSILML